MAGKVGSEASSSSSVGRGESVVVDHRRRRSSCGYCKSGGHSSFSHGIWAHSITVDDYQELLDRGWRRSGSFLYKPEMESTCCPSYTIRLKADNFVPSKEQLRAYKRMQRFLDGLYSGKKPACPKEEFSSVNGGYSNMEVEGAPAKASTSDTCKRKDNDDPYTEFLSNKIDRAIRACIECGELLLGSCLPKTVVKKLSPQAKNKLSHLTGDLLYTSSISFQIAAVLRRQQSAEKQEHQFGLLDKFASQGGQLVELSPKFVAEKLACVLEQQKLLSGLSVKACNGHLNFYSSTNDNVSGGTDAMCNVSTQSLRGNGNTGKRGCLRNCFVDTSTKKRKLEIHMKRSSFDPEEYELYKKYQLKVHNDKPDHVKESSYRNFLVDTPLMFVPPTDDNSVPPCGYGSFHQQYVVDGKLIAVGVVDILPRCLSSKYLFWDPDFRFLSLGKYAALREIEWVRDAQVHCPSLQYYYLGYYIHSCSKMRYKAAYCPSELLCPLRYRWVPFDIAKPLLDKKPYVILSDFVKSVNGTTPRLFLEDSSLHTSATSGLDEMSESSSDEDVDMEPDFEGSDVGYDEDSGPEVSSLASVGELDTENLENIFIELNGLRVKFKDLQLVFGPIKEKHLKSLEQQLQRYVKAVGTELADRMVYFLR